MSLRAADVRFLLPELPRTALTSAGLDAVRSGLRSVNVTEAADRPDLAVTTAAALAPVIAADPASIVVLGRGGRRGLRGHRPVIRRFVTLPGLETPHLIVPVDRPRVASYAIDTWTTSESRVRAWRNRAAATLVRAGAFPDLGRSITVGLRSPAPPALVAAAGELGVPADVDWFLTLGLGDPLTRAVFHVFMPGARSPRWVLKFARVAGHTTPFERDAAGLALAETAGGAVAAHAPRWLGRLEAGGLPGSLEEAAPGRRLTFLLQQPGRQRPKLRAIETIAEWIVEVGGQTAAPPEALAAERRRLREDVLPQWRSAGVPADLVARVPDVPAVLQHNDLGSWNVIVGADRFAAVDWESARPAGLPLWDLMYFLVDALLHLDGAWQPGARERHAARLLRGETPSSGVLRRWLAAAVQRLAVPTDAIGPIVTLGWLHHGLSAGVRADALARLAPGRVSNGTYGEWMARVWLTTSALGPDWRPLG